MKRTSRVATVIAAATAAILLAGQGAYAAQWNYGTANITGSWLVYSTARHVTTPNDVILVSLTSGPPHVEWQVVTKDSKGVFHQFGTTQYVESNGYVAKNVASGTTFYNKIRADYGGAISFGEYY